MGDYEVVMDGGGPWGIRLQGGKDFGVPLNVARVTTGSKAALKGLLAGDTIIAINNNETESLTHMEAQNLIKGSKDTLQLHLKKGSGASLGDIKQVGGGAFAPQAGKTMYQTDVTHSAGVDHKYNAKPKQFVSSTGGSTGGTAAKKFDPGEYARKKKEELERYKEDKTRPLEPDSEVLAMLKKTSVTDPKQQNPGSFSKLQHQLDNEGQQQQPQEYQAFRMTAEGTDLADVSPGSRAIMEDIKNRGSTGLSNTGGNTGASGGSRSFKYLQHITSIDEGLDLPPPPPELMAGDDDYEIQPQSSSFKMLQQHVDAGTTDQIKTPFDKPTGQPKRTSVTTIRINPGRNDHNEITTVNPIPKAPFPSGPNFRVGRAAAPTIRSNSGSNIGSKAPAPPAVNAGEVVNTNSRYYQPGMHPAGGPPDNSSRRFSSGNSPPSSYASQQSPYANQQSPRSPPSQPSPPPINAPSRSPSQSNEKKLVCHSCQQPLGGPFVSAIGKTWHPEHFCCSSCRTSLQNQAFVEENNQLFCEKCYNQFYAPKCAHCNNAIIGNCVNALGKSWHPDHFVCSHCSKSFGTDGYLVDGGKPYCGGCFENLFSVKCGKCQRPVTGGERYVEALNKNWHQDCFSCNYCNVRLEGNSFFVSQGMPYCQQHKGGN